MNAMQCIFTGVPRAGKSSFWQRVLGIMPEKLMPSTDITSSDGTIRLDIRGSCGFAVDMSELEWKKLLFEEEMEGFVGLVTQQGLEERIKAIDMKSKVMQPVTKQQAPTTSVKTPEHLQPNDSIKSEESRALYIPSDTSGTTTSIFDASVSADSVESLPHMEVQTAREQHTSNEELPSPSQVLEQALIMMRQAEATKNIDSASFVYFTDTGGQPEFQEALSLLMAGSIRF